MVSRFSAKWRWYDWLFLLVGLIALCAAIQIVAPTSGFARALHTGFHALSIGLIWIANGLLELAGLFNQL